MYLNLGATSISNSLLPCILMEYSRAKDLSCGMGSSLTEVIGRAGRGARAAVEGAPGAMLWSVGEGRVNAGAPGIALTATWMVDPSGPRFDTSGRPDVLLTAGVPTGVDGLGSSARTRSCKKPKGPKENPQWPFNGALMVLNRGYLGYIRG